MPSHPVVPALRLQKCTAGNVEGPSHGECNNWLPRVLQCPLPGPGRLAQARTSGGGGSRGGSNIWRNVNSPVGLKRFPKIITGLPKIILYHQIFLPSNTRQSWGGDWVHPVGGLTCCAKERRVPLPPLPPPPPPPLPSAVHPTLPAPNVTPEPPAATLPPLYFHCLALATSLFLAGVWNPELGRCPQRASGKRGGMEGKINRLKKFSKFSKFSNFQKFSSRVC